MRMSPTALSPMTTARVRAPYIRRSTTLGRRPAKAAAGASKRVAVKAFQHSSGTATAKAPKPTIAVTSSVVIEAALPKRYSCRPPFPGSELPWTSRSRARPPPKNRAIATAIALSCGTTVVRAMAPTRRAAEAAASLAPTTSSVIARPSTRRTPAPTTKASTTPSRAAWEATSAMRLCLRR